MTLRFLLSWDQDRSQQSNQQYSPHNAKRYGLGNVHPLFADHFSPDKNQDDRQSLIQEAQTVDDSRQQKVQRPKPQNREHIRCVHNERIASNAGRLFATPLFLVLLVVEITDAKLAVDSIRAVFGITRDPFIVYTSNVLAILGLRALYFLLAGVIDRLRFLDEGLAVVLVFIGGKMIGERWVHIPVTVSLGVVGGVLLIALLASVLIPAKKQR